MAPLNLHSANSTRVRHIRKCILFIRWGGECIVVGVSFYFLNQNNYTSHVDDCIKIMKGTWPTFMDSRIRAAMPFCNVAHNIPNSQLNSQSWFKVGNPATLLQTLIVSIFRILQHSFLFQVTPFHFYC